LNIDSAAILAGGEFWGKMHRDSFPFFDQTKSGIFLMPRLLELSIG
jgi:hypothetical protein